MTAPQLAFFTGSGHARPAIEAIAVMTPPRALIVGTAGSGKTALLRQLNDILDVRGVAVSVFRDGMDLGDVPMSDVLVVDDLHLLDSAHAEAVRVRSADPSAALIVATRPMPQSTVISDISRRLERSVPAIVLGQVSRSDVLAHLEEQGETISPSCLDQLLGMTGGVTWLVSHALATHHVRDCDDDSRHHGLRRSLEARIIHRLDSLEPPLRRMIESVSVDHRDHSFSEGTTAMDELIAQGYAEGLLLRNGLPVPVVRSAVQASIPAHRLAELGALEPDRLVSGLDRPGLTARRARAAWAAGNLDEASGLVDTALTDPDLRDAAQSSRDDVSDTAAAVWAARGMMATASELYDAVPPHGGAPAIRAALAHIGAGAVERLEKACDGPAQPPGTDAPSTLGIALRLLDNGLRSSLENEVSPSTLSHLVRAAELYTASRSTDPLPELPAIVAAAVAIGAGDLATAQHVIECAVAGDHGGAWARRRLLLWQSWVAIQGERPADAREALSRAEEISTAPSPRDEMLHQAVLVTLAHRYEDVPTLEATWRAALEGVRHVDVDLFTLLPLSSLITSAARIGDSTTLARHFSQGLDLLGKLGSPPLWSAHLHWAGVQQGILLNRPDSLRPHARALVAAAPRSHVAETMATAGGVWVSVLAGSVDPDGVEAAARALAAVGLAWDGARIAGHGARRTQDRKVAARLLSVARELHPHDLARKGSPAVERTTPSRATTETIALSERELDVARLVLRGKTYAEIGETIFISPRTVEHHVAHIRRRLDASSRSDLIAKLRLVISAPDGRSP
ncbi:MAG: LuxR family transcriptional regulator [Actinobacteria bacterium]|nr:LuxR family transcriptional regulator [Actinomycetota bacterium]